MKPCIINFASGGFNRGQARLKQSLIDVGFGGDFLGWTDEKEIGATTTHKDDPYSFKIFAFEKALEMGYKQILWLDASVWAVKAIDPIFEEIAKHGYYQQYIGQICGVWCNDRSLEYFGVTRDKAMKLKMYSNGGFFGLDFERDIARDFFLRWRITMEEGLFKGSWTNDAKTESQDERCRGHRHDLSCGSLIANQLGMDACPDHSLISYVGGTYNDPPESAVMHCQGM